MRRGFPDKRSQAAHRSGAAHPATMDAMSTFPAFVHHASCPVPLPLPPALTLILTQSDSATTLVEGLKLLAREACRQREAAGGVPDDIRISNKRTMGEAMRLAHTKKGVPEVDCRPLYPTRVVVLMDAQVCPRRLGCCLGND